MASTFFIFHDNFKYNYHFLLSLIPNSFPFMQEHVQLLGQITQIIRIDYLNLSFIRLQCRSMAEIPEIRLKVVFIGDSGVGKTSLLRREAEDAFSKEHLATIGVDFKIKTYKVGKVNAKAQLWDTAGQERFRSIQKPYYKNANAICLCFSLNDRKSFDNLMHWVDEIRAFDVQGQVYLIGCKSDLDVEVPTDQILIFAEANRLSYAQTSAKDSIGVNDTFKKIIEDAVQTQLINLAFNQDNPKNGEVALKSDNIPKHRPGICSGGTC